jgi:outer membrane autotransporter protein
VGLDHLAAPGTLEGFALGGGGTRFDLSNNLSGRSDTFQLGLKASQQLGAAHVAAALSCSWHQMTTTRSPQLIQASYAADFEARSIGARGEVGYRFGEPSLGITPYAALQMQNFRTPAYSERPGAGSHANLALNDRERSASATRSELGASLDKGFALEDGQELTLRARAAWLHDPANNPDVKASFQTLAQTAFSVSGTEVTPHLALLSTSAEFRFSNRFLIEARVDGEFAKRARNHTGTAALRYQW